MAGLGGGWAGYATGAITGLAGVGTIIGGGVGSEIAGGSFTDGALGGLAYNIGYTIGSSFAPMPTNTETANLQQSGDSLFYAGERIWPWYNPMNLLQAVFDPGPFNHTDIGLGGGKVAGSHPGMGVSNDGPDIRDQNSFPAYRGEKTIRIKGHSTVGRAAQQLATDMKAAGVGFRYLSPRTIFASSNEANYCSQFTAQSYQQAGQKVYGMSPNAQYWYLKK